MIVRTWEYRREQEQKRSRRLSLALQGIQMAIRASGTVPFKTEGGFRQVQETFQSFLGDLLEIGELPKPESKMSLARLKWTYGSRWRDHLDELREEDRDKV